MYEAPGDRYRSGRSGWRPGHSLGTWTCVAASLRTRLAGQTGRGKGGILPAGPSSPMPAAWIEIPRGGEGGLLRRGGPLMVDDLKWNGAAAQHSAPSFSLVSARSIPVPPAHPGEPALSGPARLSGGFHSARLRMIKDF